MTLESYANPEVLAFYEALPFNYSGSAEADRNAVQQRNALDAYPILRTVLRPNTRVLDVGCGAGWFVNSVAHHIGCACTGVDFNPVALERATAVAALLEVNPRFELTDLFLYRPEQRFDVVNSLGVLHHTDNCLEGVRLLCREFVRPGGFVHLGLYHAFGRKPFLEHFAALQLARVPEEKLFERFRELQGVLVDDTHSRSWFRDQVLHPHETQHTLQEVAAVFEAEGVGVVATSINGFAKIEDLAALFDAEHSFEELGRTKLEAKIYFPGFFTVLGRKALT